MVSALAGNPSDPAPDSGAGSSLLLSWPVMSLALALAACSFFATLWHTRTTAAHAQALAAISASVRAGGLLPLRHARLEENERLVKGEQVTKNQVDAAATDIEVLSESVKSLETEILKVQNHTEETNSAFSALKAQANKSVAEKKLKYQEWLKHLPTLIAALSEWPTTTADIKGKAKTLAAYETLPVSADDWKKPWGMSIEEAEQACAKAAGEKQKLQDSKVKLEAGTTEDIDGAKAEAEQAEKFIVKAREALASAASTLEEGVKEKREKLIRSAVDLDNLNKK